MATIEEVIKMIERLYRKNHNQANLPCPDEEALVCFAEGRFSKEESRKMQEHVVSCQRCAEVVSLFCRKTEERREVPEFLLEKAKGLVEEKNLLHIFRVVLALKEKALQILETSGDVVLENEIIPLPVLRSRQISEFPEEIKLIKEFKDIKITLHIQKKNKDDIRINLNLADKASLQPLGDLRLALLKGNQELESYTAVSGNVVFDKISFGRYAIEILRKDNKLGIINLEIQ